MRTTRGCSIQHMISAVDRHDTQYRTDSSIRHTRQPRLDARTGITTCTRGFYGKMISPHPLSLLVARVQLQIDLHSVAYAIIRQAQLVVKRPFPLSLQHDLVHRSSNLGSHHHLEGLDRIRGEARDLSLCAETVVDCDHDHWLARSGCGGRRCSWRVLTACLAVRIASRAAVTAVPVAVPVPVAWSVVVPSIVAMASLIS